MVDRKVGGCFFLFSISFSSVPTPGINNEHSLRSDKTSTANVLNCECFKV
jgi:hypothetical protein